MSNLDVFSTTKGYEVMKADELLVARATSDDLANSKALGFGGAGSTLATILLVAQIGVAKQALVWSLCLAAAAMPLWVALALSYDLWLTMKLTISDLYIVLWLRRLQSYTFMASVALTFASITCLLYSLVPVSAFTFVASSVVGLFLFLATLVGALFRLRHLLK